MALISIAAAVGARSPRSPLVLASRLPCARSAPLAARSLAPPDTTPAKFSSSDVGFVTSEVKYKVLKPNESETFTESLPKKPKPNQLVDLSDFQFLISPKICKNGSFLLIIVVPSNPLQFDLRMAIRETWGSVDDVVKLVFTFGVCNHDYIDREIVKESELFGDIVQGNFKEHYYNLTYKHVMGLKWVESECTSASYVVKVDNDVFVHKRNLLYFLVRELSPWGARGLIACLVLEGTKPIRSEDSEYNKWLISEDEYVPDDYPRYCSGSFIIYSRDVLPRLVLAAEVTDYMFVDDVFVTGILAEKVGIPRTNIGFLYHGSEENKVLMDERTPRSAGDFLWGPYNVQHHVMRTMWNITNDRT